ncbi:uncharacterized protein LOC119741211 [Patiria miniata]|uniref:Uncharacterized protein n=1 Tax=Patiria miniata TaxID=46514 RepID=A0A914B9U9_PATMI|nr:uncharacterized protein LOC119741211 [Patiria miniata]
MSVEAMMPHDSRSLPAISQRRSSSLQEGFRVAGDRQNAVEVVGAVARFTGGPYSQRTDSSGKSSSGSDSRVSECSEHRSGQGAAKTYSGGGASQLLIRDKIQLNGGTASDRQTRSFLPRLIDDQGLLRVPKPEKERLTFSSRSLEIFPSRDLISEELRMRTISLPSLENRRKHYGRRNPVVSDHEEEDGYTSYTTDDSSDGEENPIVEIDPFPNVGADSYLNSRLLPDFLPPYLKPWTPGIRKTRRKRSHRSEEAERKRKELEALTAKERKRKAHGNSRPNRRRSVRSDAFARKRESEAAKRHPVRKQFVYSELVQVELQKLTPKRLPGGKLKPIYDRRTKEGDIDIPRELRISMDSLSLKPGENRIDFSDSPAAINKRRKQELQALLEKRKKLQRQMVHKKKRKVRFVLPDEEKRRHEVSAQVNVAGGIQNETRSRSTSPGQSSNNDVEEASNYIAEQNKTGRETSPNQLDNRNPEEFVKDDEGRECRMDRTNSWVASHTSHNSLVIPSNTKPDQEDTNNVLPAQNSIVLVPENVSQSSRSRQSVTSGSSKSPLDPDISKDSAVISDFNSDYQLDGAPSNTRDTSSAEKRRHLSVGDDVAQAAQLNPLPGKRPDSPLLKDDGVLVADAPVIAESGAVREIKFLSERLPSIIISDT